MNEQQLFQNLRIVFMGTPEFAVASLDVLVAAGCNIVAVITAPDKPAGRGMTMHQSAVKKFAGMAEIPVLQPEKLRDENFLTQLRSLNADLQICVAFRMMPQQLWSMPPMGTINLHGSLLPQYRGAAPINHAIINGEKETGVTTFRLKHEIDTGNILLQERIAIEPNDTAGSLHDKMKAIGAGLLLRTVQELALGQLQEKPQYLPEGQILHHAPKIFSDTCFIHFDQPVSRVHDLVRGLSPYPGAYTFLKGKKLKIFQTEIAAAIPGAAPGAIFSDEKSFFEFSCADGNLRILELQLEGKKKMKTADFLRGFRFS